MKSNLHIHSRFSDGKQWPDEIVQRAKNLGLECIALTDHDNFSGISEFLQTCNSEGIQGYAGVEIDCVAPQFGYDKEMLAYFPSNKFENTKKMVDREREKREKRMIVYIEKASDIFHLDDLSIEELVHRKSGERKHQSNEFTLLKPDLVSYLQSLDIPQIQKMSNDEFKSKFFKRWDQTIEPELNIKLTVGEVIETVKKDGGFAVIPHIATQFGKSEEEINNNLAKISGFMEYCKNLGAWGVEMYYYKEFDDIQKTYQSINHKIRNLGESLGLSLTYGSDCHGEGSTIDTMKKFSDIFYGFQTHE